MNNELLNILNSIILKNKEEIEQKEKNLFSNFDEIIKEIEKVLENPDLIKEFDLEKLNKFININNSEFRLLKFLKKCSQSQSDELKLTQENKVLILDCFKNYLNLINFNKEKVVLENQKLTKLKENYKELINLKNKILNHETFNKQEFILFSNYLKENITDINEYIKVIKELSLLVCGDYEKSFQEEEVSLIKITNLNREDLESLFNEFNYNFNNFRLKEQEKILLYGSLENIRNILKVLKENNINLNINHYSKKISEILLLSNRNNISTIIENIKIDFNNPDDDLNQIFTFYLNSPSLFINGIKKYELINKGNNKKKFDGKDKDLLIAGAFNNYQLNRQYFIELGVKNINDLMKACSSSFTISHMRVKKNVEAILSYGIKREVMFDTLSSLSSATPLDIIDQFIEAGFYKYIINAPSRLRLPIDSAELIRLINAKKAGWKENEMFGYASGVKKQKYMKLTKLNELDGKNLMIEPRFKFDFDSKYQNIEFEEPVVVSESILENEWIKILDNNFKHDELTYKFNEIIISRYKVLRYFNALVKNGRNQLEDLRNVIFKNTIITKNEYNTILSCLNKVFKENVNNHDSNNSFIEKEIPSDVMLSNFFIEFLDDNFYKDNNHYYDFNGIKVLRNEVLNNFKSLLTRKETMTNPLETLYASIIKVKEFNAEERRVIAICLKKVGTEIKLRGRRI